MIAKYMPAIRYGIPNEIETIEKALKELEKALKLYPEGYFSQFKKDAGERGVLIMQHYAAPAIFATASTRTRPKAITERPQSR